MAKHEHVIGRFRLQPGRGLVVDGVPVPLGMKALDILTTLVEAAGEIVTKSELMDRVWPGIAVEEHNIQVHVSALRKALGADADWIRTVPRLGYRFAGPVPANQALAEAPPSAPPLPPNRLFGRDLDLMTIRARLADACLITLVGPGGIGKTRLALEVARMMAGCYRDGVAFVDLSTLADPTLVASQIGVALGIELKGDAAAQADLLVRRLRSRELLILLDNCEHLIDAAASLVERLLQQAPAVRFLATSREPLSCVGEQVYRLPLLPIASEGVRSAAEAMAAPAVALLVDRLQAADQRFELTDTTTAAACAICRRLDGLPLAIEMAGALVPGLGLETVAARLEESFRLPYSVMRTIVPRHRSLEATLDWSYALLSPAEQVMLRRLAVFPGRFSLQAAEAVVCHDEASRVECGDLLAGLVRKSLVSLDPAAPTPYRLLETIRSYAAEKLEAAGEHQRLRGCQARYVGAVLARAVEDLDETSDVVWLDRYGGLLADLRSALSWCFRPGGDAAQGLLIVGRSRAFWPILNLRSEGRRWAEIALAALTPETDDGVAGAVWTAAGYLNGERSFEQSAAALRKAADLLARARDTAGQGAALAWLGQMLALSGQIAPAAEALTQARRLLGPSGSKRRLGDCAVGFGTVHTATGAWADAHREIELAAALYRSAGSYRLATVALHNLADVMWSEDLLDQAIKTESEALELARRDGNRRMTGHSAGNLTGMLTARGDIDDAFVAAREAVPLCREDEYLYWLLPHLALLAAKAGRLEDAARLWGYSDRVTSDIVLQMNEQRAIGALRGLLREAMDADRIEALRAAGAHLGEDEAAALALA